MYETARATSTVLMGKISTTDLFRTFDREWSKRYSSRYIGFGPTLGRAAKNLLAQWPEMRLEDFALVCRRYLEDNDRYLLEERHPFLLLCSGHRINKYRADRIAAKSLIDSEISEFLARKRRSDRVRASLSDVREARHSTASPKTGRSETSRR